LGWFVIVRVVEVKVAQVTKFGSHDPVDQKGNLQKEKDASVASMANGTEAPSKSSVVQSYYV
jgi:hypothetical protein